jgi:predicted metal-dependent hydrolase
VKKIKISRPVNLHILDRKITFDFQNTMNNNRYWSNDDPVLTHFLNAFQETFPEGERLFIDAALDCRDKYSAKKPVGEELLEDFKLFARQEVNHGKIHQLWTDELIREGYEGMAAFDEEMKEFRDRFRKRHSPKYRLAFTAAAEHYTASLAHMFIHVLPKLLTNSKLPYRSVLLYHAMEELEHKSVCFDLFQHFSGNYFIRFFAFLHLSYDLFRRVSDRLRYLLKKDGLWDKKYKQLTKQFFFGKQGIVKKFSPRIISYLNPWFHPWKNDDRGLVDEYFRQIRIEAGIADFKFE